MSSEWKEQRLGDITRWASGGTPSKQNPEYWGGSIPWISASSMKSKVCAESDERISEEAVRSGARMCDPGTILLLVRGSELHKRIPIGIATKRVAFNQDVKAITTCSEDLSGDYLYYLLKGNEDFLLNSVEFTGIGAGKLETLFLQDLVFPIPTREEQKVITDFMIALDDKIELNRKTNETLEAIAKALFKSWFLDFDPVRAKAEGRPTGLPDEICDLFPDSFEDSELGEIPSGWKMSSIYEVSSVIYGAPFSSSLFNSNGEGVPVARIRDLPTESPAVFTTEIHPKGTLIKPGDIVVGMDGEFRAYLWGGSECWMNQRVCQFVPKANDHSCFVMESLRKPLMEVEMSETATTVIHLGKGDIDGFKIVIPDQAILDLFGVKTRPLLDSIVKSKKESRSLTQLRDSLLPKLISGEIRIPDAERLLEEVGV